MRITSELMQFEIGTSTRRYFPPSGTAGFERVARQRKQAIAGATTKNDCEQILL